MTVSEVIPVERRSPLSTHIVSGKAGTKSISLSLEVVKGIWRRYPTLPDRKKLAAPVLARSSIQDSNVLELNLGVQIVNETSSGSLSTTMSNTKLDTGDAGRMNGDRSAQTAAPGSSESPSSERAVNDLLPITCDSAEASPAIFPESLPSCKPSQSSPSQEQSVEDGSLVTRPPSPSTTAQPQYNSESHSTQDLRSALLDSMQKMIQLRYPDKDMDHEQLSERFAQRLPDSEVREFMQMGTEVIDQLRRSGKLEEAKRKYLASSAEEEQRRTRRRLDSASPRPTEVPHTSTQNGTQGSHRGLESGNSPRNTPARSNNTNHRTPPKAPRAMSNIRRERPAVSSPGQLSTTPMVCSKSQHDLEPASPDQIRGEEFKPLSETTKQASSSQRATPTQSAVSATGRISPNRQTGTTSVVNDSPRTSGADGHDSAPGGKIPPDLGVARILLAKMGHPSVGLLSASFDLDEQLVAAVRRWGRRSRYFDPGELSMRLYLVGIPTSAAEKVYQECPPNAPPSFLAEAVSQLAVTWPRPGTLYVSLNMGRPEAISWPEHVFGPSSPALDLSSVVVEGTNHIQFIQLEDHSQTLFVVYSIPPSQAEQQEALALYSRRKSWVQLSQNHIDKAYVRLWLDASNEGKTV